MSSPTPAEGIRSLTVAGRTLALLEGGQGRPVLYLHGLADVHGASPDWLAYHRALLANHRLLAPAHPSLTEPADETAIDSVDDAVLHYVELLDRLELPQFDVVGHCVGGWIAADLAVRYPARVRRLVLVGATGLHVPGHPIGDVFFLAPGRDGGDRRELRDLLFRDGGDSTATTLVPDLADPPAPYEDGRDRMLRFAAVVGWRPPYLHDRKLLRRLRRITCPALVVWGQDDRFVPAAHGRAYAEGIPAARLHLMEGAGHAVHAEQPEALADLTRAFLAGPDSHGDR